MNKAYNNRLWKCGLLVLPLFTIQFLFTLAVKDRISIRYNGNQGQVIKPEQISLGLELAILMLKI